MRLEFWGEGEFGILYFASFVAHFLSLSVCSHSRSSMYMYSYRIVGRFYLTTSKHEVVDK